MKNKLKIIYEDKFIIVIDKDPHLLTVSTDNEKEKTLFHQTLMYLKKKNKNNKLFIVHRLDRDTSGLVVLAKDEKVKYILQDSWEKNTNRYYLALVEGNVEKEKDIIKSYLKETSTFLSYSTGDSKNGKLAITEYKKISSNNRYSLLDIRIHTGRKNQIRVHMKDIGHIIVGDKKYGSKVDPYKRMCLHSYKLFLVHPVTHEKMVFETKIPKIFDIKA